MAFYRAQYSNRLDINLKMLYDKCYKWSHIRDLMSSAMNFKEYSVGVTMERTKTKPLAIFITKGFYIM